MVVEKEPKGDCGEVGETVEVGEKLDGLHQNQQGEFSRLQRDKLALKFGIFRNH